MSTVSRRLNSRFFRVALAVTAVVALFNLAVLPLVEPVYIFFPVKAMRQPPSAVGLDHQDVYFQAADGAMLHGWFLPNRSTDKVILFLHGNGGNISHRLEIIRLLHALPASVFIIDYHGYGQSEGFPSEERAYLAARAAYGHLVREKEYQPRQIVAMGSSLGGAVAIWLADNEEVGALIVQKTFSSLTELAPRLNPLYRKPLVWIRSEFNSLRRIKRITAPKLIVHSRQDEYIPFDLAVKLYEAAGQPKELLLLDAGGHNDIYYSIEYIAALRRAVHPSAAPGR